MVALLLHALRLLRNCIKRIRRRKLILTILATLAICHTWFLVSTFLKDESTVITEATFYTETKRVKFPNFMFCFAKVFTYNNIREDNLRQLYNDSAYRSLKYSSNPYSWNLDIKDIVIGIKENGVKINVSLVFERIFYLPTQTCWRIITQNVIVYQAGRINTLDIVINAAVYDDLVTEYNSPLTYLSIVPYFSHDTGSKVPYTRSSIQISPGRFSAVGFSWTKVDSSHRSKHDKRTCHSSDVSKDHCLSMLYKKKMFQSCHMAADGNNSHVSRYASCGLKLDVDHQGCEFEPCMFDLFRFTKSEGFIKFDNELSVLGLNKEKLVNLRRKNQKAVALNSKFNRYVKSSFRKIADNIDYLSDEIALALSRPKGYKCKGLIDGNFNVKNSADGWVPNVVAEREHISMLRTSFLDRSWKIWGDLLHNMRELDRDLPYFAARTPPILHQGFENTINRFVSQYLAASSITRFRKIFYSALSDVDSLRRQAASMLNIYLNLHFTEFIKRYSSQKFLKTYFSLLNSTINSLHQFENILSEGAAPRSKQFAHQDEGFKVIYSRSNFGTLRYGKRVTSAYRANKWLQYAWFLDKGIIRIKNISVFTNVELIEVIYGELPAAVNIPLVVDQFCAWYHNYFGIAERFHGMDISFSLQRQHLFPSELIHDYTVFVLSQIIQTYDTPYLFSLKNSGLEGAERKSCARLSAFPIYAKPNVSMNEVNKRFKIELDDYFGRSDKYSGKAKQLLQTLLSASHHLTLFTQISARFEHYYASQVSGTVGVALSAVLKLRGLFVKFHKFNIKNQGFKRFLVGRLQTVASLTRTTLGGDSEENISQYLSKKGRILIGEIQIEMASISQEISKAQRHYKQHKEVISNIQLTVTSVMGVVMQGVVTAKFSDNSSVQNIILRQLSQCNVQRLITIKTSLDGIAANINIWLRGMAKMVARARRYTKSLDISKSFMRNNFMRVSLYYDSLTVLTETNERLFSLKSLVSKFGAALRIYLRMTLFKILNIVSSAVAVVITWAFVRLSNQAYQN